MQTIQEVLISRDGLTMEEANEAVEEAKQELFARLENGDSPYDICEEYFGLEPDYIDQLMF